MADQFEGEIAVDSPETTSALSTQSSTSTQSTAATSATHTSDNTRPSTSGPPGTTTTSVSTQTTAQQSFPDTGGPTTTSEERAPDAGVQPDTTDSPLSNNPTSTDDDQQTDTSEPVEPSDEVPMTDHCASVADWDPAWIQWEDEVLLLVNEYRAQGANCDSEGEFGPTTPLAMDPILRCSARLHSLDMFDREYFEHTNPDGLDPFDRMDLAGFSGSYMGENIAMGQQDPVEVMVAWIDSDGHCANVMNTHYTLIGVGYYPGSLDDFRARHYWTQNFGAPRQEFGGGNFGGQGGQD